MVVQQTYSSILLLGRPNQQTTKSSPTTISQFEFAKHSRFSGSGMQNYELGTEFIQLNPRLL